MSDFRRPPGFTLIELLAVVALIAVLASLLAPALLSAREKAHQSVCTHNLKQIAAAFLMYQDNWDESYPAYYRTRAHTAWNDCAFTCHWSPTLKPFLTSLPVGVSATASSRASVFICPSNTTDTWSGSYAMNRNLGYRLLMAGDARPNLTNSEPVLAGDVKTPSRTILVYDTPTPPNIEGEPDWWGDHWSYWKIGQPGDLVQDLPVQTPGKPLEYLLPRHHRGNLVSFADGHVAWVKEIRRLEPDSDDPPRWVGDDGFRLE